MGSDGSQGQCPDGQSCINNKSFDLGNLDAGCTFGGTPATDSLCKNGIMNQGHFPAWPDYIKVCCSSTCGVCGGKNCMQRPGGENCCIGPILSKEILCTKSEPPCI